MYCIDLFAGAGGLSLGLQRAGFNTAFAVDCEQDACETYKALLPKVDLKHSPIEDICFRQFDGVDLVAGGLGQPFSSGGKALGGPRAFVRPGAPVNRRCLTSAMLCWNSFEALSKLRLGHS